MDRPLTPQRLRDLKRTACDHPVWLWHGYLAPGAITLLTSQWKTGKTTLLSLLLDRMFSGGDLIGEPVKPGKAVIVSEESADLWVQRAKRYRLARHVHWFCRPFAARPSPTDWESLVNHLLTLHTQVGLSLAAIDPLASFFPRGSEFTADAMLSALAPLRLLTAAGVSVLVLHHPSKAPRGEGSLARGTGVLCSHADVLMELHRFPSGPDEDRRRRLLAWSRWDDTPHRRLITLTPEADDYLLLSDDTPDESRPVRDLLWAILESAAVKLTCRELLDHWPSEMPRPAKMTLWRILSTAVDRNELLRDGAGTRPDPFRYWLPCLEARWKHDPTARVQQSVADAHREIINRVPGIF